jgi:hypothetical protein
MHAFAVSIDPRLKVLLSIEWLAYVIRVLFLLCLSTCVDTFFDSYRHNSLHSNVKQTYKMLHY